MALARRIAYNVVFNSALKVVSTVFIALISIRLTTGYLGQSGFGEYATVLAFFAFFGALADLGLATVAAREISRHGAPEEKILGNVAALRLVASLTLLLLAPIAVYFLHYSGHVKIGILIVALALLFAQFSTFLNGIFQKRLAMDRVAMVEFVGKLIQLGVIFTAVKFDLGFIAIVSAHLITMAFNAVVVFFLSRSFVRFRFDFDWPFWKHFVIEALPLGITTIITFTYFKMDTILLSFLRTSSDVGIYNVAYKIMENLIFFPAMLVGLIMPLLSRTIYHDRPRFQEIANKTLKVFLIIVLPIVIGTVFLAPHIVRIVSGAGFEASAQVLQVLIFSLAFIFFGHYFNMLLVVGNAQKRLMGVLLGVAFFNISLNLFLIRAYSYIGAAVTSALTELLVIVVTGMLTYRVLHYFPRPDRLPSILTSAFLMAGSFYLLRNAPLLVSGFVGMGVYATALWFSRAVTSSEIVSLFSEKNEGEEVPLV
ncbi:MAG: flippase [Candidatus Moraniibacteriota bacterium]